MKISLVLALAAAGTAGAVKQIKTRIGKRGRRRGRKLESKAVTPSAMTAESAVGQRVLSRSRRLDQDEEIDYTWVAGMSLKFQGCYHTQQWNEEADGDEDVRISTQRLVRFRLCPSDQCTMENAAGCSR